MTTKQEQRRVDGLALQAKLTGGQVAAPRSLVEESWTDFVYAEIWSRPQLDQRARFLIALASAAGHGAPQHRLLSYVRGALACEALTLAELQEAALHIAVYAGWDKGGAVEEAVRLVAGERGETLPPVPPLTAATGDADERMDKGFAEFRKAMLFDGPAVGNGVPLFQHGILNYVFAEMWCRPGLDQRSRRFLTLVGVADSAARVPIATHFHAAMVSGNCTPEELQEFVLQYGVHAGWPRASVIQSIVLEMISKVQRGLNWNEGD